GDVRLELTNLSRVEPPETRNAVRLPSPLELTQPWNLALVDRDDELPALDVRQPALRAVGTEQLDAETAEARLQGAGRVVDPGVDDTARAAGLVRGDLRLLLEDRDGRVGMQLGQPARNRQAENPRADHAESRHREATVVPDDDPRRVPDEPRRRAI